MVDLAEIEKRRFASVALLERAVTPGIDLPDLDEWALTHGAQHLADVADLLAEVKLEHDIVEGLEEAIAGRRAAREELASGHAALLAAMVPHRDGLRLLPIAERIALLAQERDAAMQRAALQEQAVALTVEAMRRQLAAMQERLAAAEARPCVEICKAERAAGNGGCGGCSLCCKEATDRAEKAEGALAKVAERLAMATRFNAGDGVTVEKVHVAGSNEMEWRIIGALRAYGASLWAVERDGYLDVDAALAALAVSRG